MPDQPDVLNWAASERNRQRFSVETLPLSESTEWSLRNGSLVHKTGRFFEVRGIEWTDARGEEICSPFILQPEVGILGIAITRGGGESRVLLDAKFEPGNVHGVDIAPCFQATKSNFEKAHGGAPPALSDIFLSDDNWHSHVRQSEQGTRFLQKWNANVVVMVNEDIDISQSMRWCTLPEVSLILRTSHTLNTDARSVIATSGWDLWLSPESASRQAPHVSLSRALRESLSEPVRPGLEAESTSVLALWDSQHAFSPRDVPLVDGPQGVNVDSTVPTGDVVVTHHQVSTDSRERHAWDQPLIGSTSPSEEVLFCSFVDGVPCFFFAPVSEVGLEHAQLGNSMSTFDSGRANPFIITTSTNSELINASELLCAITQSDEGGRFNRQLVTYSIRLLENQEQRSRLTPQGLWLTPSEIQFLARREGFFTNEARTTISLIVGLL
jgi:oxidase EvaA